MRTVDATSGETTAALLEVPILPRPFLGSLSVTPARFENERGACQAKQAKV